MVAAQGLNGISIYDIKSGKLKQTLPINDDLVSSIDLNKGRLIVGLKSGKYNVWKTNGNKFEPVKIAVIGFDQPITAVKIHDSTAIIASYGRMYEVHLKDK